MAYVRVFVSVRLRVRGGRVRMRVGVCVCVSACVIDGIVQFWNAGYVYRCPDLLLLKFFFFTFTNMWLRLL